jgi:hypothetical protein
MTPTWAPILGGIAGLFSLAVSLYTLWKQRLRLSVDWPINLSVIKPETIYFGNTSQSMKTEVIFMGELQIVNPSPNDIGYFDLRAFDANTNLNSHIITRNSIPKELEENKVYYYPELKLSPDYMAVCTLPAATNGIFPKNSFTTLTILVYSYTGTPISENLAISFKIPVWSFWWNREPMSNTSRHKYKAYRKVYKLTGWEGALYPNKFDNQEKENNN